MRKYCKLAVATFSVLLLALPPTANAAPPSQQPSAVVSPTPTSEGAERTYDDELAEIAGEVPGFGGAVLDGTTLRVALTTPSEQAARRAAAALQRRFGTAFAAEQVLAVSAAYDIRELNSWHKAARPVLAQSGVVFTDLDEVENRLRVAVQDANQHRAAVESELQRVGVPLDAVIISEMSPIAPTLRERRRPLRGGLQIQFQSGFAGLGTGTCTLGFPAIRGGVTGFVTNSHCTRTQGEVDNGRYWQATRPVFDTDQIGAEVADPAYTTTNCPANRRCRRSDSAFVRTESGVGVARGTIPRLASGSTAWNGSSLFRISGEGSASVNQTLTKVGRTTGRTGGPLTNTCVTANVADSDITLICQNIAQATVDPGDSGSPVFLIANDPAVDDVRLVGLLWGESDSGGLSYFVYSSVASVDAELGTLSVCHPNFIC